MTVGEAHAYLRTRLEVVSDTGGIRPRARWNNDDMIAVRVLLRAKVFAYATEAQRIEARRETWRESKRRAYARKKAEAAK